jgi:2-desacetyl-2-hydroxyethyl bacteriochlorophyllide A dehydrogenase
MSKVVVFTRPKSVEIEEVAEQPLGPGEARLRTLYSGISAGTELTAYRGSNPYLHKRWDPELRLFTAGDAAQQYPVRGWGYEEVGEVVELASDVEGVAVGDRIYGTWGHRSRHVVPGEYARERILPAGLEPVLGIFSQIAAIALNGVHDARIRIGETVAIFGTGVPGQIAAQLAKRSGARVIAVDLIPERLELAASTGAAHVILDARDGSVAERIRELTDGRGVDVAIEASGSTQALHEAVRSVAYSAKVVALGFFQGSAEGLYLGEEFHHNRVNIVCSQIFGVDPELSYRWNKLRLVHTAMRLQAEGVLDLKPLITHQYPYVDAAEAFRLLDQEPEAALQVVLDFTEA